MIKKIQALFKHNFVKDTATLQVGAFLSTGLSFIASIVYARFLGPDNYGIYALIFAFVALIGIFRNWGEGYATLTLLSEAWAKRDKDIIKNIIIFYIKISILTSLTVGILAIISAPYLTKFFYHNENIGNYVRIILFASYLQFLFLLIINILQASRKIKHLTILENLNKLIYIILPITLVLLGFELQGIVWGYFLTALIFFIFSIYFYRVLYNKTQLLPTFTTIIKDFKNTHIKKYFKFGFQIAVDKNIAALYSILPLNLLGVFIITSEIGYFKIALSYISLALVFVKPVSRLLQVQLPKSKIYGMQELKKHFFKTSIYSFFIVLIVLIPMILLAKPLVWLFYGKEYLNTVKIIYMLWPFALFSSMGIGVGSIFRTINKMKVTIVINSLNIIIGLPIVYWLIKNYGVLGMIITTTCWISISIIISLIYVKKYFDKNIIN